MQHCKIRVVGRGAKFYYAQSTYTLKKKKSPSDCPCVYKISRVIPRVILNRFRFFIKGYGKCKTSKKSKLRYGSLLWKLVELESWVKMQTYREWVTSLNNII